MSSDKKKYVFILCPPFQGSTLIYRLIASSSNVSSFLGKATYMGEGAGFIVENLNKKERGNYIKKRWEKKHKLNFNLISDVYHKKWDLSKDILCEKSPPYIIRAKEIYEHFSKKGDVYFIIQIRDPYTTNYGKISLGEDGVLGLKKEEISYKLWDVFAKEQKENIEKFKYNSVLITYEELCDDIKGTTNKIIEKMPFLKGIKPDIITNAKGIGRLGGLKKVTSLKNKEEKTKYFKKNSELLEYFGYKIIN